MYRNAINHINVPYLTEKYKLCNVTKYTEQANYYKISSFQRFQCFKMCWTRKYL